MNYLIAGTGGVGGSIAAFLALAGKVHTRSGTFDDPNYSSLHLPFTSFYLFATKLVKFCKDEPDIDKKLTPNYTD